jgi:RNA polymerase sigma-70 factor (ECF subfamily)
MNEVRRCPPDAGGRPTDAGEANLPSEDGQAELAALLERAARGDRDAFRVLYQRTAPKLFASVRRILGSNAAAEDAVQDAYVRIWTRSGDFDRSVGSPIAWMTTIARHAAIDIARRGAERIAATSGELDAEMADPLAAAAYGEGGGLAACLEKLEPDRRGMVLLAYCYGWSREELSRRFDRPVATVKTVLRRTLIALKECLGG